MKDTFQTILSINQVQDVKFQNFIMANTQISQLLQSKQVRSIVEFGGCDKIQIQNIFITKVNVQNFQLFMFLKVNDIKVQNIFLGIFDQPNDQMNYSYQEKEQTENIWEGILLDFQFINTVLLENLNVNKTQIKGDQNLLYFQNAIFDESFQGHARIENININLNGDYNYLHGGILSSEDLQSITLNQINILIESNQNDINLNQKALFSIVEDSEAELMINQFYIEVLNIERHPDFLINSNYGAVFSVYGSESKAYFNKVIAKNIRNLSSGGFGNLNLSFLEIQNSYFENLSSKINGGALDLVIVQKLAIKESQFIKCHSDLFGGAINVQIYDKIQIDYNFYQVEINGCSSLIGGGIIGPDLMQNINGISYFNNSASIFGSDYCNAVNSYQVIKILQYNQEFQDENIRDTNIPYQIQQDLSNPKKQAIIEQAQPMQTYYFGLQLYIDGVPIQIPSNFTEIEKLSLTSFFNGQGYNYLDLLNFRSKDKMFYFMLKTPFFQQQFTPIIKEFKQFLEIIFLQSNQCLEGQIFKDDLCIFCSQNTVTKRGISSSMIQNECLQCQDTQKIKDCYAYKSFLNPGYIRYKDYTVDTDLIQKCSYSPQNCQGGEFFGNQSCAPSYIGPECLECEFNYTRNNSFNCYQCGNDQFNKAFFALQFIISLIFQWFVYLIIEHINEQKIQQSENNYIDLDQISQKTELLKKYLLL
ncbi:transmembrane protein, putative (macronuclear) [Tetrahymena thermophila SB210]|uniref:Transmembrane protein, putative n=1 Tax=Tetrahymena thermophila (strain SB210) TaxID=312017 RepID=I7M9L8_TETTS|nr:transmembrane protein, putative [Tetrahymena thermophila SB210]EAS02084.2 transmembrane protein, putative [Tetrahymena thermophila SB210]|eukprot:XP_001022329.2 transmembrane protein, putative [Tetrahymena thermophila SB210]